MRALTVQVKTLLAPLGDVARLDRRGVGGLHQRQHHRTGTLWRCLPRLTFRTVSVWTFPAGMSLAGDGASSRKYFSSLTSSVIGDPTGRDMLLEEWCGELQGDCIFLTLRGSQLYVLWAGSWTVGPVRRTARFNDSIRGTGLAAPLSPARSKRLPASMIGHFQLGQEARYAYPRWSSNAQMSNKRLRSHDPWAEKSRKPIRIYPSDGAPRAHDQGGSFC